MELVEKVHVGKFTNFSLDNEGVLWISGRLCVPNVDNLREEILEEAYFAAYSVHPVSTKMYHDIKDLYWWDGMKKDVAEFVSKCLTCQQVKAEHQKPFGKLQPLPIPEWKWERVTIDFVTRLPRSKDGYYSIWVIVDRLTKSAHFLPIKATYPVAKLARLYIKHIVYLHLFLLFLIEV